MVNWSDGECEIDGMIVNENTKVEKFEMLEKYDVDRDDDEIVLVASAPNTVSFIDAEFL